MSRREGPHAAKLRPGCVTWPIIELLQHRGAQGATTRECKQAIEAAGHELMNVGAAMMDIRKRAPVDLGCQLRSEPGPRAGRSRVYRYFLEGAGLKLKQLTTATGAAAAPEAAPAPPPSPEPVQPAQPAPQASRSDDRQPAGQGVLFDNRPIKSPF